MPSSLRKRNRAIASGRPRRVVHGKEEIRPSSKTSRKIINTYHQLRKAHERADLNHDGHAAADAKAKMECLGGIGAYQAASRSGQSLTRGGDTSRVLVDWFLPYQINVSKRETTMREKPSLLEIGSLDSNNACTQSMLFDVCRIDLRAHGSGIMQQDFMRRPLPATDRDRFACISLSLVLNFVAQPEQRGEMLKRVSTFLLHPEKLTVNTLRFGEMLPALFLVLPAPCILNSRYLDLSRMGEIMEGLGYDIVFQKVTSKLIYMLWRWNGREKRQTTFLKAEVNPGRKRNNFCILLK